ncbi:MAG: RHS repeat-associated core domain-containing protein [Planctomycetaceae bacterium]
MAVAPRELDLQDGGRIQRNNFYGPQPNELLAFDLTKVDRDGSFWTFGDQGGSVGAVGVYDVANQSWQLQFQSQGEFGEVQPGSAFGVVGLMGDQEAVIFSGHELDPATGLYDMQARWYDPQSGRFLSTDPLGYAAGDVNLYRYVGNSPTNGGDPTGLYFESWWDVISVGVGITSVGVDIANIWRTGEGWGDLGLDLLGLGADVALTAIPGVPGGVSVWLKTRKATRFAIQTADGLANAYQSYQSYQRALRAAEKDDLWGVGFNLLGAGLGGLGSLSRTGQGLNELGLEFYLRSPRFGTLHSEFLPSPFGVRRRYPQNRGRAAEHELMGAAGMQIHSPRRAGVTFENDHHIASPYGDNGQHLRALFDNAGLSMGGWYNRVMVPGHQGPHGWYNQHVLDQLSSAVSSATPHTLAYSQQLFSELVRLRYRVLDPNDLLPLVTTSITELEKLYMRGLL